MIFDALAKRLAVDPIELEKLAVSAGHRYKTYKIPKRLGGFRIIDHPSRPVKALQRWVLRNVLFKLPVHHCATAYKRGATILANAQAHLAQKYLLRVDFHDFFPSLSARNIAELLARSMDTQSLAIDSYDISLIVKLVTKNKCLTIGAPTSPHLSNALLFEFDSYWSKRCRELDVVYTRYADDLYFSSNVPNRLSELLAEFRKRVDPATNLSLRVNEQKVVFTSKKRQRNVTGLILSSQGKISVGRVRKRHIRSLINSYRHEKLPPDAVGSLRGMLAYVRTVEPEFLNSLIRKYGHELIAHLITVSE